MVLADSEWSGRRQLRLSPAVSGIYLNRNGLDSGFDEHGQRDEHQHIIPISYWLRPQLLFHFQLYW